MVYDYSLAGLVTAGLLFYLTYALLPQPAQLIESVRLFRLGFFDLPPSFRIPF